MGDRLGRYRLIELIGSGGMAQVFRGRPEEGSSEPVAIKVIEPALARDPRFVGRFFDEARLASQIHHPNVCAVVDFGLHEGLPYLVMEHLPGLTLSAFLRRAWRKGSVGVGLGARVVLDAARGLHCAHELRGAEGSLLEVVHRDVSPQNLMVLPDGHSKVLDFGIARARGRLVITQSREVRGKLAYAAPELSGALGQIDRRADVWSLGVVLWEATVGRRLFAANNDAQTAANVLFGPIAPPTAVHDDYPEPLAQIVMDALERSPAKRIASAGELAERLNGFLASRPKGAPGAQQALAELVRQVA